MKKIGNAYGVAGLMGNLYAESGLRANNLQNSYEKKLNITDAEYTRLVDENAYPDFVKDKAGYGLAQWIFWSRKQALLDFAKSKGIEPEQAQIAKSKPLITRLINAYIVRNILGDEGFFPLFERDDEITKKAVEYLTNN